MLMLSLCIVEKRKDEIAIEVSRKVDAAKKQMEREMMLELEKNLQNTRNKEKQREVSFPFNFFHHIFLQNEMNFFCFFNCFCFYKTIFCF